MLVQDTRAGRWAPAAAIRTFLAMPEGEDFSDYDRWECLVYTQHSGGWLRRRGGIG